MSGRPRAATPLSVSVTIRLTAAQAKAVDSRRGGQTRSDWLRSLVKAACQDEEISKGKDADGAVRG